MNDKLLRFELSPKDVIIKKMLNKEFLELEIHAISDIFPNLNDSAFTQDSLEKSKHTCYNKPILGAFNVAFNDFLQHNGENKQDKETGIVYWDTNGKNDEKILGVIRESDTIQIVEEDGLHWLKINCVLWTYYAYKQVKKILKSGNKKVSVEVLVVKSHYEDKIQVIDEFILTGITILGDNVHEGIPGAHLSVLDLMQHKDFTQQIQSLSFAYNKKDGKNENITLENFSDEIYNYNELEEIRMTYSEKMNFLRSKLAEVYGDNDGLIDFHICDFTDDYVIINDYKENKYFKIPYTISTDEDVNDISFDFENKVEQLPSFKDISREFVQIDGEDNNIDELFAKYNSVFENNQKLQEDFNAIQNDLEAYKNQYSEESHYIIIDEVKYDVQALHDKYEKDLSDNQIVMQDLQKQFDETSNELNDLKAKMAENEAEQLCNTGIAMTDEEDELDDDDKKCIKNKCSQHQYSSISEIEDDIARALYQKKKNNRSKNFQVNVSGNFKTNEPENIFDKL